MLPLPDQYKVAAEAEGVPRSAAKAAVNGKERRAVEKMRGFMGLNGSGDKRWGAVKEFEARSDGLILT